MSSKHLISAHVLTWTASTSRVLCPFSSCQKIHTHHDAIPEPGHPVTRVSHCDDFRREYRLSYPFEDEGYVRDLGFELDREKGRWRTVGDEDFNPWLALNEQEDITENDITKDMNKLCFDEENPPPKNEPPSENYSAFVSYCVNNDLKDVAEILDSSPDMKNLINHKDEEGQAALSLACMEGHLEVVKLLQQRGADIDSVNIHGRTPLMEAISFGHGCIAEYLVFEGASTSIKDKQNTSILDLAKSTLKELEEKEWMISRLSNETRAQYLERRKNREKIKGILELCEARNEIQRRERRRRRDSNEKAMLLVSGTGLSTQVTVMLSTFTAPMTRVSKTFAYLDRGYPYEKIFAISGYTGGPFGGTDGCLDREIWTERVFMFSRIIGHELTPKPAYDDVRPGSSNACHAEKQAMAFYLWTHTLLEERPNEDESLTERCGHSPENRNSKTTIYIRNDRVCPDCDIFRDLIEIKTGISFLLQTC